jgi:hypothetical protein
MRLDEIEWEYQGDSVRVGMTWHGQGASVLMLPALSSISTRSEMWPLQQRLGSWFTTLAIDWVGFGDRPRPPLRWSPEIYRSFLAYLLDKVCLDHLPQSPPDMPQPIVSTLPRRGQARRGFYA